MINAFSDEELREQRGIWLLLGALAGLAIAAALTLLAPLVGEGAAAASPVIERQTEVETVARIRTRYEGRELECRLYINHATRSWALSC